MYKVQVREEAAMPSWFCPALLRLVSVTVCTLENTQVVGSKSRQCGGRYGQSLTEFARSLGPMNAYFRLIML